MKSVAATLAAAAEIVRLRAENQRLTERLVVVYEEGDRQAMRILTLRRDRDRLSAVIDQVRELHSPTPSALDGDGPDDYCAHCGEAWPCPTAALLPDTHTAQEDPK